MGGMRGYHSVNLVSPGILVDKERSLLFALIDGNFWKSWS